MSVNSNQLRRIVREVVSEVKRKREAISDSDKTPIINAAKIVYSSLGRGDGALVGQDALTATIEIMAERYNVSTQDIIDILGPNSLSVISNPKEIPSSQPGRSGGKLPVSVVLLGVIDSDSGRADAYFYDGMEDKDYKFRTMKISASDIAKYEDDDELLRKSGALAFFEKAEVDAPAYCKSKGWKYDGLDPIEQYPVFA